MTFPRTPDARKISQTVFTGLKQLKDYLNGLSPKRARREIEKYLESHEAGWGFCSDKPTEQTILDKDPVGFDSESLLVERNDKHGFKIIPRPDI